MAVIKQAGMAKLFIGVFFNKGIFAHLTYIFANKSWQPTTRCFPDFKDPKIIKFFNNARERISLFAY